ncbi:MAG: putative F420-0 ABC transporter substrate-binding protein [Cellulomonadaceae bacterium]|nr:putative F420-0 ABC transporter substrate-binding protein [Cellulomonadaceae bacterium]
MRAPLAFAAAALLAVTLAGCGSSSAPNAETPPPTAAPTASAHASDGTTTYPLTLTNCGLDVTFDSPPQRVVTIKSSTAEMMLALGLGDRIVGAAALDGPVPAWLDPAGTAVDTPLSDGVPGQEATLALHPDLIYAGWESNLTADGAGDREALHALSINTYVSPPACRTPGTQPAPLTFDDVFADILQISHIFDADDAALALVNSQRATLDGLTPDPRGLTALWWSSAKDTPYVGAGAGAPQMMMEAAGFTNIAAGINDTWTSMSWEQVIADNPDIIIVVDAAWNTAASKIDYLTQHPALSQLPAVRDQRFIIVPFPATEAGVRNVSAVESLVAQAAALP